MPDPPMIPRTALVMIAPHDPATATEDGPSPIGHAGRSGILRRNNHGAAAACKANSESEEQAAGLPPRTPRLEGPGVRNDRYEDRLLCDKTRFVHERGVEFVVILEEFDHVLAGEEDRL